ncbi:MAG: 16S rRNA processing protein RimM [Acidobacteria bacterium]|nr:16S rRNA processing protein RimM [Acidobacteriota bacterium]
MSGVQDAWVTIALLGKTRGNRGELTALPLSTRLERFDALTEVYLFGSGERFEVESTWFHNGTLIFKFHGIDTISDAERLCGAEVRVPAAERVPLEEGEFFQDDLIGCDVIDRATGRSLGHVTGWDDGGGSGLLVVGSGDSALLIPFARRICVEIDPAAKRIAVELPEGLKDLNRP